MKTPIFTCETRNGRLRGCFVVRILPLVLAALLVSACYEQKQEAVINPDGSGKVTVETRAAVPAVAAPDQPKPSPVEFGKQMARDFINQTRGVEGWADLSIRQAENGDASVKATAYFPDLNKLRFGMPLVFSWKPREGGDGGIYRFAIEREHGPTGRAALTLADEEVRKQVKEAQARYREQQPALQTALSTFKVTMTFTLSGEVTESRVLTVGEGKRNVTLTLEGKKLIAALDKFMADEAAVTATIKSGNDLTSNDDFLLEAMFGQKGPVEAIVKVAPGTTQAFDYAKDAKAALAQEARMLKEAGVEMVPAFVVPGTQPGK